MADTRFARHAAVSAFVALITASWFSAPAQAEPAYPNRPVRMIVPFAPGGGSDIVGRILAHALNDVWEPPVVIDNRPGAGSTTGTAIAAKSPPDGYSLLVSSSAIVFSPALYKGLTFDVQRDFKPVSLLARQPSMLVVAQSVKASSVPQLLELAKSQPGKLAYGSAGIGSATHLGGELLRSTAGVQLLHVPYKSAGLAMSALLGGEVQVLITNMATVLPHVKSGRVRTLGISSKVRSPLAPEIPTVDESGLKGFEYDTWYAMLVPAGTPTAVVQQLHRDSGRAMQMTATQSQLTSNGITSVMSSSEELRGYLESELKKWDRIIRSQNVAGAAG